MDPERAVEETQVSEAPEEVIGDVHTRGPRTACFAHRFGLCTSTLGSASEDFEGKEGLEIQGDPHRRLQQSPHFQHITLNKRTAETPVTTVDRMIEF